MSTVGKTKTGTDRENMAGDFVYLLWHTDAHNDEKLIGAYRTEETALAATERAKAKRGFSDKRGKFHCVRYELNQDHWTEGFTYPKD
jgi:hypothetical protein